MEIRIAETMHLELSPVPNTTRHLNLDTRLRSDQIQAPGALYARRTR
jgi:hypothetical protein